MAATCASPRRAELVVPDADLGAASSVPEEGDIVALVERALRTAIAIASFVVGGVTGVLGASRYERSSGAAGDDDEEPRLLLPTVAGASLFIAAEAVRRSARMATSVARIVAARATLASAFPSVRRVSDSVDRWLTGLDDRWRAEERADAHYVDELLDVVVPIAVDAVVTRLDLTERILVSVDLDRIVDSLDLDRLMRRIDLDDVVARIDIEAIVGRLPLARIAGGVIDELDLAAIATRVIDEVDLPRIVRESTGTMADETVEGLRAQGIMADKAVTGLVNRLLRRNGDAAGGMQADE
jgi:hypothetical protein